MAWFPVISTLSKTLSNLGVEFNNPSVNLTTSAFGAGITAKHCIISLTKGMVTTTPWCKRLYYTSAALSGISCTANTICLLYGKSGIGTVPIVAGVVGYGTSVGARACTALAYSTDPAAALADKALLDCIDKGLS